MDGESFAEFHADLRAIDRFQGEMDWGPFGAGAKCSLNQCIKVVSNRPVPDPSLLVWAKSTEELPERYRAALVIFLETNDIGLVRQGLLPATRSSAPFGFVGGWVYLTVILVLAYGGLALFMFFTAPQIDAIRMDLMARPTLVDEPYVSLQATMQFWMVVLPIVVGTLLGTFLWSRRGSASQNSDWAVSDRLGWIGALQSAGMTANSARRFGLDLVCLSMQRRAALDQRLQFIMGESLSPRWLAESLRLSVLRRQRWIRLVLPTLSIVLIGGGVALGYGLLLFWPLASLLIDMSQVRS